MIDDAFGAPIYWAINGRQEPFGPLLVGTAVDLLAKWAAEDRAVLLTDLEAAGASSADRLTSLRDFAVNARTFAFGQLCAFQLDRALATIRAVRPDAPPLPPADCIGLAKRLWCIAEVSNEARPTTAQVESGGVPAASPAPTGA